MALSKADVLAKIDAALGYQPNHAQDDSASYAIARSSRIAATIAAFTPPNSPYREQSRATLANRPLREDLQEGILQAVRATVVEDALVSFEQAVRADVFVDLLSQASYLLSEGYVRAAAVLGGAALEEHLRQMSRNRNLPTDKHGKPMGGSALNQGLYANNAYSNAMRAQCDAWQARRNSAAHGDTSFESTNSSNEIGAMIEGIRAFITAHPS